MLIPCVSNATVDKQKGSQKRQGRKGIIRVLERKRGTQHSIRISQSCHRDQKGKTNNNQGCSGEQITAFPTNASLYCQICGSLSENDRLMKREGESKVLDPLLLTQGSLEVRTRMCM